MYEDIELVEHFSFYFLREDGRYGLSESTGLEEAKAVLYFS